MKQTLLVTGIFVISSFAVHGKSLTPKDSIIVLDNASITAFNVPILPEQTPFQVTQINHKKLRTNASANNAYLLRDLGNVFVQQSQLGGGSPVIRGFEASRVLLVVDGVRMNNAIYRTGHLQNIITIDKNVIDNIQIIHGANSTLYGTDALGGIITIQTENPFNAVRSTGKPFQATLGTQYNSAFSSLNSYGKFNYGNDKFSGLTILSFNKIGDLVQGSRYKNAETEVWKRNQYIETQNGEDFIRDNKNSNRQRYSGYDQVDFLQKLAWKQNAITTHNINLQYSTTNDVPRYDRLTDRRNGQLRWAEWSYGPQKRMMGVYKLEKTLGGFFDQFSANLNYQNIEESRFQRAFQNKKRQSRIEQLHVGGYNLQLLKNINNRSKIQLGTDGQLNFLNSTAYYKHIETGEKDYNLDSRYPDGTNRMHFLGLFAQYFTTNKKDNLNIHAGLRANYSSLYSQFVNTAILNLPFNEARQNNLTYSANLGSTYKLNRANYVTGAVSTAFRVPNIDDLAKVFESAGGVQLVVPNPSLKPEQVISFDLGYRLTVGQKSHIEFNGFYTFFRNAIALDKFTLNGQDSVVYNGDLTPVVANQNKAKAFIYGASAALSYTLLPDLTLSGAATYTYGRYREDGLVPLDHVPPFYGKVAAGYDWKKFVFMTNVHFNGAKQLKDYNPYGEDNLAYATPNGMPGWYTWNFYVSKDFKEKYEFVVGIENILDQNYRVFASGISAPGRNFIAKVNVRL